MHPLGKVAVVLGFVLNVDDEAGLPGMKPDPDDQVLFAARVSWQFSEALLVQKDRSIRAIDKSGEVSEEELQKLAKEAGEQLFEEAVVFHSPILAVFSARVVNSVCPIYDFSYS